MIVSAVVEPEILPVRLSVGLMLVLLVAVPPLAGCGPAIPPEDLGTVLEEVPEIHGSERPFELPESASTAEPTPPAPVSPEPGAETREPEPET